MSDSRDTQAALERLGMNMVKAFRHVYDTQGVSAAELQWVVHGVMGHVVSWGLTEVVVEVEDLDPSEWELRGNLGLPPEAAPNQPVLPPEGSRGEPLEGHLDDPEVAGEEDLTWPVDREEGSFDPPVEWQPGMDDDEDSDGDGD